MSSEIQVKKGAAQKKLPLNRFELWQLFNNTNFAISRARESELAKFGLTLEQAILLNTLIKNGGSATLDEIAERTIRQYHSVSTLVKRMTKSGLVKKVKYSDKKKFEVSITDKGYEIYSKIPPNSLEMIFSVLSIQDQESLATILQSLKLRARNLLGLDYKHPFLT